MKELKCFYHPVYGWMWLPIKPVENDEHIRTKSDFEDSQLDSNLKSRTGKTLKK
jgi:hypothetical protein